ncbi:MAG: DNA-formamidopyrimidine glycosylase family protein [Candidatus Thorarchaeota archaeon]
MPELPELIVIAERLNETLKGQTIRKAQVHNHIVIHGSTVEEFIRRATQNTFERFYADGKFLVAEMASHNLVVNPMLTGRFLVSRRSRQALKNDMFSLRTDSHTLWYSDRKKMGRVYIVEKGDFSLVAGFEGRGPSPLDSTLTVEDFKKRIRRFRGQIKNILRNQSFMKGIGNAYADEILLYAGILPFRKRSSFSDKELDSLYKSCHKVLTKVLSILSERSLDDIAAERRDFLMIHNRGGSICPLCGGRISEVKANRFITSYCQTCQS